MWQFNHAPMTGWVQLLVGAVLLFLGRKMFWLFVGAIGFVVGVEIAARLAQGTPEFIRLLLALGLGAICSLLAVVLQRLAVAVAGWLAGGYLALRLAVALDWQPEAVRWLAFLIGAVLAAVLVSLLFDWALIVLSALTGAILVSDAIPGGQMLQLIAAAVLFVIGALTQVRRLRRPARGRD